MDGNGIRALLVEDNKLDVRIAEDAVGADDGISIALDHVDLLKDAVGRLRGHEYDVILLDLSLPDSRGLDTVARIHAAAPEVPIIVLTGSDDEAMAVQSVKLGAHDYLVKGQFDTKVLLRTMRFAIARRDKIAARGLEPPPRQPGRILGFIGAKGGCGTTTLASHVARNLSQYDAGKALLADLDFVSGVVPFLMKTDSTYSISDAMENIERVDSSYWQGLVSSTATKLDVLAGAPGTKMESMLERLRGVLRFTRTEYDWIVLDLGAWSNAACAAIFDMLDQRFVVTTPDLLALYRMRQICEYMQATGHAPGDLSVILNRMSKRSQLDQKEIAKMLGISFFAILPEAEDDLVECYGRGKLLDNTSGLGKDIDALSRKVAGLDAAAPKQRRRFSFLG